MVRSFPALLFLSVSLASVGQAVSLQFDPNEPIAASQGSPRNERPRVVHTEDGTAHVVWAKGELNHEGLFHVAAPSGGSYGDAVMLSTQLSGVATGGGSGPTLRTRNGFLAAGWEDRNASNRGIWVARSTDAGAGWEAARRADPQTAQLRAYQATSLFSDGRMAQIWMAYGPGYSDPGFDWSGQDGSGVFSPPIEATALAPGETCDCCYPDQEILSDGQTVLVAFRNNEENLRDIHVARSTDGGTTFPQIDRVDTNGWVIAGCPSTGPSLASDGQTVLVSWISGVTGIAHVWLARSLDGGASWETMQQLDDLVESRSYNFPQVAIRGPLAVVVWQGLDENGLPGIFAIGSVDAGASWGETTLVTDDTGPGSQTQPTVSIAPDLSLEVVWKDLRLDSLRLFRAVGRIDPAGVSELDPPHAASGTIRATPNPFRDATTIALEQQQPMEARLTIFDAAGRRVATLADRSFPAGRTDLLWDGRDAAGRAVPNGVYFVRAGGQAAGLSVRLLRLR